MDRTSVCGIDNPSSILGGSTKNNRPKLQSNFGLLFFVLRLKSSIRFILGINFNERSEYKIMCPVILGGKNKKPQGNPVAFY